MRSKNRVFNLLLTCTLTCFVVPAASAQTVREISPPRTETFRQPNGSARPNVK